VRRLWPLLLLVGCAEPVGTLPTPDGPAWPDAELDGDAFTLVFDGERVDGAVTLQTGPAGLGDGATARFVLTNRSGAEAVFDGAWLQGDAEGTVEAPESLAPDASADVVLALDEPGWGPTALSAQLVVPGTDVAVDLVVDVPAPLRIVGVGSGGYTVTSDDYGATWTATERGEPTAHHSVVWGNGRFLRTWADGLEWSDPGRYAWSEDGEVWTESAVGDTFWSSGCAFGLERFVCARGDALSWSVDGGAIVHESTAWRPMNHAIAYADGQFVGVGRDLRRVRSEDGAAWVDEVLGEPGVNFNAVVHDGERWVAAGGLNGQVVATSADGVDWDLQWWPELQYAAFTGAAVHDGRVFLSGNRWPALVAADGEGWEAILPDEGGPRVLASVGGWLLGSFDPWHEPGQIVRSRDGVEWETVHVSADGTVVDALAVEGR
jgi:hypothetical protein